MMRWIVRTSLRFRFLVLAMGAALIVLGAVELSKTPVDVFPEFAPPTVEVQTEAVGLTPAEVESLVTVPLETP
jgi:Cu/Ag efflux pump CusA